MGTRARLFLCVEREVQAFSWDRLWERLWGASLGIVTCVARRGRGLSVGLSCAPSSPKGYVSWPRLPKLAVIPPFLLFLGNAPSCWSHKHLYLARRAEQVRRRRGCAPRFLGACSVIELSHLCLLDWECGVFRARLGWRALAAGGALDCQHRSGCAMQGFSFRSSLWHGRRVDVPCTYAFMVRDGRGRTKQKSRGTVARNARSSFVRSLFPFLTRSPCGHPMPPLFPSMGIASFPFPIPFPFWP